MRILVWLFRAALFLLLFAFALNNLEDASVRWFFGYAWHAPMVVVVLVSFASGCFVGALAVLAGLWRRGASPRDETPVSTRVLGEPSATPAASQPAALLHPPRDGL